MTAKPTLFLILACTLAAGASAIEPKALEDVDISQMTRETQKTLHTEGVHLVWWIPPEYWAASMQREGSMTEDQRKALMDVMENYSMLGVVQAEVSPFGSFSFYERELTRKGLSIEIIEDGKGRPLEPIEELPPELQMLLKILAPVLEGALGNMGKNLYFFVLPDRIEGERVMSPFGRSALSVTLTSKKGTVFEPVVFEMPLDALYVPRRCPNGKPAHVSWVVCPWDGSPLPK